mgnify:CR=1 FL=1
MSFAKNELTDTQNQLQTITVRLCGEDQGAAQVARYKFSDEGKMWRWPGSLQGLSHVPEEVVGGIQETFATGTNEKEEDTAKAGGQSQHLLDKTVGAEHKRCPEEGDAIECEMAEPSAPRTEFHSSSSAAATPACNTASTPRRRRRPGCSLPWPLSAPPRASALALGFEEPGPEAEPPPTPTMIFFSSWLCFSLLSICFVFLVNNYV